MAWTFYNSSGEAMIEDGAMSIANNTNDRVVTATGADPASLNGEANLTFDGTNLTVAGNVIVGAGKGIDFAAQTATSTGSMVSELFDHYEEGTFTPTINDDSDNDSESQAYSVQVGRYTRIGNRVFYNLEVQLSSLGSLTTSQGAKVAGLPFTCANVSNALHSAVCMRASGLSITALASCGGLVQINTDYLFLRIWDGTTQPDTLLLSELSADGMVNLSGVYEVAT
jgi:hypothetical protein